MESFKEGEERKVIIENHRSESKVEIYFGWWKKRVKRRGVRYTTSKEENGRKRVEVKKRALT